MANKVDAGMPQSLDLTAGYTLRVTAVDSSGALVANVKVGDVVITADQVVGMPASGNLGGQWFLVPGPAA